MRIAGSDNTKAKWPAAVVFDLDGTLVDSAGDITSSINDLMISRRLTPFPESLIRDFVGDGSYALVERAFSAREVSLNPEELQIAVAAYDAIYGARLVERTTPYVGVNDVLSDLKSRGIKVGICTNKFEDKAIGVAEALGLSRYVDVVIGGRKGRPGKPSPIMLLETLDILGVGAMDAIMVGDSVFDVQCARAAGVAMMGVSFGYSQTPMRDLGADVTIDSYAGFEAACAFLRARDT